MNFEEMSEGEILKIGNPIMDNFMDASTRIDHEAHVRDFTERMKHIVTKDYFQRVRGRYQGEKGFFKDRQPIAVFRRQDSVAIIWKQSFAKVNGEFVAEMVLVDQNGKYLCDHAVVF